MTPSQTRNVRGRTRPVPAGPHPKQAMTMNRDLIFAMQHAPISVIHAAGTHHQIDADTGAIHQQAVSEASEPGESIDNLEIPLEAWLNSAVITPGNLDNRWQTAPPHARRLRKVASRMNRRMSRQAR